MSRFKALLIEAAGTPPTVTERTLDRTEMMPGDTLVRVTHSTVNYKDGLAITGRAPVVRRFPMVPGIDFAGIVEETGDARLKTGDAVVLNGWGVGETHWGAYAEYAQVPGEWLIPLPRAFSPAEAMAIGTAGYTAMLAVLALECHGVSPKDGPALVTGAAGGVGSVAVALLARLGWAVTASTGRPTEAGYLRELGRRRSSTAPNCRHPASHSARNVGPRRSTRSDPTRSSTRSPKPRPKALSRPAGSRPAWTCPARWRPSSCAVCRSSASIR